MTDETKYTDHVPSRGLSYELNELEKLIRLGFVEAHFIAIALAIGVLCLFDVL